MTDRSDELDQFWDIGRLLPPKTKKSVSKVPTQRSQIKPTPIESQNNCKVVPKEQKLTTNTPFIASKEAPEESLFAEHSSFSPLIPHVRILNWKSSYNYNDYFCRIAASLYNKNGSPCEEVHFFSYVPQYSQLNHRQLAWYLWWRDCVRKGSYPKTDVSYVLLLAFEVINLREMIDTTKGLNILISLWSNYVSDYPQLSSTLGEWICDYSLIHGVPIRFPDQRLKRELLSGVSFPESFYNFNLDDKELLAKFLLSSCNSYNYRKSKFYNQENREFYDKYILEAFVYLLEECKISINTNVIPTKKISRSAYPGALCADKTRKHIEIEYVPLCFSIDIRNRIGEIVKCIENRLRTYLGIRSRLGVNQVSENAKEIIDRFFDTTFMHSSNGVRVPEYEKLYDATPKEFSIASALNIEQQSWAITEKLVDAFDEEPDLPIPTPPPLSHSQEVTMEETCETNDKAAFLNAIANHLPFFAAAMSKNAEAQQKYCQEKRLLPDAVADEINEIAVNVFGDVLLEEADIGYQIIEEYQSIFE